MTTNTSNNSNSVRYSRKINLGDYHHAEASITVAFDGDVLGDQAGFEANARAAFFEAKGLVLSELGAAFNADPEGLIREVFGPGVGIATPVTSQVVEGGLLLGNYAYEGVDYPVKLSHSKFGPFIVWGDTSSPMAAGDKAFMANVATWDVIVSTDGKKDLDPAQGEYTLAKAAKQIQYALKKK